MSLFLTMFSTANSLEHQNAVLCGNGLTSQQDTCSRWLFLLDNTCYVYISYALGKEDLTHYQTKKKFRLVQIERNSRRHFKVH